MLASEGVDLVPFLADEREGVAVAGVVDVVHHELERHVGYAEARRSAQASGPPVPPSLARSDG